MSRFASPAQRTAAVEHARLAGIPAAAQASGYSYASVRDWCRAAGVTPLRIRSGVPPRPKGTCTEDGCDRPAHCRGLCIMHYRRVTRTPKQKRTLVVVPEPAPIRCEWRPTLPPLDHAPAEGWREAAACRDLGLDWFPGRGEAIDHLRIECSRCPVQVDCLTAALDQGDKHGVFGGASEKERRAMRRSWPRTGCRICATTVPYERREGPTGDSSAPLCPACERVTTRNEQAA